jgi:hypothetical protein
VYWATRYVIWNLNGEPGSLLFMFNKSWTNSRQNFQPSILLLLHHLLSVLHVLTSNRWKKKMFGPLHILQPTEQLQCCLYLCSLCDDWSSQKLPPAGGFCISVNMYMSCFCFQIIAVGLPLTLAWCYPFMILLFYNEGPQYAFSILCNSSSNTVGGQIFSYTLCGLPLLVSHWDFSVLHV